MRWCSMGGMFALSRFADADDQLLADLEVVAEFWRAKPGNVAVHVLRNVDDQHLVALVSHWEDIGSYRRAFNGYDAKLLLTPVMLRAVDEPSAYLAPEEF